MNTTCDTFQYVGFTYFPVSTFSDFCFEGLPVLWDSSSVLRWINWRLADGWSLIITTVCNKEHVLCKSQSTFLGWEQGRGLVIERWSGEQRDKPTFTFHSLTKRNPLIQYYHILNAFYFVNNERFYSWVLLFFCWQSINRTELILLNLFNI